MDSSDALSRSRCRERRLNKKLSCRRETTRCLVSLNISLSHIKIIRNDILEKGVNPYQYYGTFSEIFSIKIMVWTWPCILGLQVTRGHWNWYHSKAWLRCPIRVYGLRLAIKVTVTVEFVSHVSYSLLLTGIHVIAPLSRLTTKRPDWPVSRTPSSARKRRVYVPQPTFLFPLETPLRLSRKVLHEWKDNSMLAKPLAAYTYLCSIVSEFYDG